MTIRINRSRCPHCGTPSDAATDPKHINKAVLPKPGDFTVCGYCGGALRFAADLRLVAASVADLMKLQVEQPDMFELVTKLQRLMRQPDNPLNR